MSRDASLHTVPSASPPPMRHGATHSQVVVSPNEVGAVLVRARSTWLTLYVMTARTSWIWSV
jgi:hypothetical protein